MKKYIQQSLLLLTVFAGLTVQAQNWQTDFQTAKELAAKDHKKIILVFSGSDWCAPCIKLEKEIWNSETFKNYARDHYVMLRADFPRRKKNRLPKEQQEKNNILFEKYNPQGYFPLVVVLNSKGEVLGTLGYEKITPQAYIDKLNSF